MQLALACSYTNCLIIRAVGLRQTRSTAGASTVAHFAALGNECWPFEDLNVITINVWHQYRRAVGKS